MNDRFWQAGICFGHTFKDTHMWHSLEFQYIPSLLPVQRWPQVQIEILLVCAHIHKGPFFPPGPFACAFMQCAPIKNKSSQVSLTGSSRRMCSFKSQPLKVSVGFWKTRSKDHFYIYYVHIRESLRLRMVAWKTSVPLASVKSEIGVRKHQHEVWLGQRIILVYNMSV